MAAEYTLSNDAVTIDNSITRVANADTSPQPNSANMVTSGGVYTAVNNIDLTNMASGVITTEANGIANYDTDGNIPTNAAVKDYVDNSIRSLDSGFTTLGTTSASGTASADGFIICQGTGDSDDDVILTATIGGVLFTSEARSTFEKATLTVPIANGESYSVTVSAASSPSIRFKGFS